MKNIIDAALGSALLITWAVALLIAVYFQYN